MQPHMHQNMQ